jgi:hypothetical protein
MDFITAYAIYMTVAILVVGLWATRVPHEDIKVVFILAIVWPITITAILGFVLIQATGWDFDVDTSAGKMFNYRKPTNPKAKGFALCLLGVEFQVYKLVK